MMQRKRPLTRMDARAPLNPETPPKPASPKSKIPRPSYQDVHGVPLNFTALDSKS